LFVELADQRQQTVVGGVDMGCQFGDLIFQVDEFLVAQGRGQACARARFLLRFENSKNCAGPIPTCFGFAYSFAIQTHRDFSMHCRFLVLLAILLSGPGFSFQPGDWVLARWQGGEYWFPGVVQRVEDNRITVAYDDGTRDTRPIRQVKPYDWDVGTRVECRWAGGHVWYRGRISAVRAELTNIRVNYDDGDREETHTGMCRSR
jgi:hypothetical protein